MPILLLGVVCIVLSGVWGEAYAVDRISKHGLSLVKYEKGLKKWTKRGYRLTYVDSYTVNKRLYFATIWSRKAGPEWAERRNMSLEEFNKANKTNAEKGFRLHHISAYSDQGKARYVAIWFKKKGPDLIVRPALTQAKFKEEHALWSKKNYRLSHIKAVGGAAGGGENSKARIIALWERAASGGDELVRLSMTRDEYIEEHKKHSGKKYYLRQISSYGAGDATRYIAVWGKNKGGSIASVQDLTSTNLQSELDNKYYSGGRVLKISGYPVGKRIHYSAIWKKSGMAAADKSNIDEIVAGFMKKHKTPGLAIAIAKDGKLVFAKGFGLSRKKPVWTTSPAHKFRLGDVSKTITELALLKLVEQGAVKMEDPVFGKSGILGKKYGKGPYQIDVREETVGSLVEQHGFAGSVMVKPEAIQIKPNLNPTELMSWAIDNGGVSSEKLNEQARANLSYSALGLIIEKKSGMSYEKFVRKNILYPAGVRRASLARNKKSKRSKNEVVYYRGGDQKHNPYNLNLSRMAAPMGWVASPIDLVRLALHIDGQPSRKDILSAKMVDQITTGSLSSGDDSGSWFGVGKSGWKTSGYLPGSSAIVVRADNGFCWAIVSNSASADRSYAKEYDRLGWKIIKSVKKWPDHDLF